MPIHKRPQNKGNLYIKFEIIFPPNNFVDPAKIAVCITAYCSIQSVFGSVIYYGMMLGVLIVCFSQLAFMKIVLTEMVTRSHCLHL